MILSPARTVSISAYSESTQAPLTTHVNAARQRRGREPHLKLKLVIAFFKPPITTDDSLVLEKRREAIAKIFRSTLAPSSLAKEVVVCSKSVCWRGPGVFVYLDEAMQTNNDVCDPYRLDDFENHASSNNVSRRIALVRVFGLHEKLRDSASF